MRTVYLDHAATTPLDEAVLDAMLPYLRTHYGNASSVHRLGRQARFAVEQSRERVAACLGCEPAEVLFTSGGTESNNTALFGVLTTDDGRPAARPGLVTSATEHEAILQPAEVLTRAGHPVTVLTPPPHGAVTPAQVAAAITPATGLVSLMAVNNEIGTETPLADVAAVCQAAGVPLHTDAVQAAGVLPLYVDALGVDLLTLTAHKFYGPKGVGVLFVRAGTPLAPRLFGGAQERRRRGGTENVAAVVGLAMALERAQAQQAAEAARLRLLQRALADCLHAAFGEAFRFHTPLEGVHPTPAPAAPHIVSGSFVPVAGQPLDGEMLLLNLDLAGIAASSGSACTSGAVEPSHVLRALSIPAPTARATLRFSLGRTTTAEELAWVVEQLQPIVARMRR